MADMKSITAVIDTDITRKVAENIKQLNSQMRDDFVGVQSAISALEASWHSYSSVNAIESFDKIKELSSTRYLVLDSYANFLLSQIGEGYEITDKKNKSIADAFK